VLPDLRFSVVLVTRLAYGPEPCPGSHRIETPLTLKGGREPVTLGDAAAPGTGPIGATPRQCALGSGRRAFVGRSRRKAPSDRRRWAAAYRTLPMEEGCDSSSMPTPQRRCFLISGAIAIFAGVAFRKGLCARSPAVRRQALPGATRAQDRASGSASGSHFWIALPTWFANHARS